MNKRRGLLEFTQFQGRLIGVMESGVFSNYLLAKTSKYVQAEILEIKRIPIEATEH